MPDGSHSSQLSSPSVTHWPSWRHVRVTQSLGSTVAWCHMKPEGRPCFSLELLDELVGVQSEIRERSRERSDHPVEYLVLCSDIPGVFNLGGDLAHFAACIDSGDRAALRLYARRCIEVLSENAGDGGHGVQTIALVQGKAFGGGFEGALSCSVIIAERSATFALPEVSFNLFPGMGAYSFLSRRLGAVGAERLMLNRTVHTAEEMHQLGVVDILVDDKGGEAAVAEYVGNDAQTARGAVWRMRRSLSRPPLEELRAVADMWVDAAFKVDMRDLRKMRRFASSQERGLMTAKA